ncbi:hypothetical protein [Bacillus atrophaeus]|uniref:hypothetical protein n=1 Tax=Bacillus atrophaeus TaxID=1452 RepID=UPI001C62FA29|nr:hypothetical protein [Bacillus atrophaeus]QYG88360.1 hypothetical protein HCU65_07670 [Bacillus atrophaeus]
MITLFKYDEDYNYVDGAGISIEEGEEIPEGYTDVRPPDGMYKRKFDPIKKVWYESATQEYIDSLQPPPPEPTEFDILEEKVADLYYLIAMGGV